jgi:hypothetical protein
MSMRTVFVLVASGVSFLVAAKAHGRQLRLERELEGYHHVVFGGTNPPFVEALWRADRVRYWSIAVGLAVGVLCLFALARARGWHWPFLGGGGGSVAWLVLWGAPVVAFVTCGLWSLGRFVRATSAKAGAVQAEWAQEAVQGSSVWFAAAVLAAVLVLSVSLRRQ